MTNYGWLLSLTALTTPALSQTTPPSTPTFEVAERSTPGQPAAIIVTGSRISQLGIADSANAGVVTGKQLAARTVYRPGELLEVTPGLIVSQHSGEGKANQFYLRGFNLDHGTDFALSVDEMPINLRTHAHGQGYADTNFISQKP